MAPILRIRMRIVACALAVLAAGSVTAARQTGAQTAGDQQSLALTGCLERAPAAGRGEPAAPPASAAATPIYRLTNAQVVEPPGVPKTASPPAPAAVKTSMTVVVSAKDDVNLAAHAGTRVEVAGTVSRAQWTDWLTHSVKESMATGTGGRGGAGAAAPPAGAPPPTQSTGQRAGSATGAGAAAPAPGLRPADASPTVLVTAVTRAAGSCDGR